MSSDFDAAMQFAHRANIDRYRNILASPLSAIERRFVERRLAEEQEALDRFVASMSPEGERKTKRA